MNPMKKLIVRKLEDVKTSANAGTACSVEVA